MKIAIPSETDECLESARSGHFGHAPYFTIVTVEDGKVIAAQAIANVNHDESGCGGVIEHVIGFGIDGILTAGMGRPPLIRFTQSGVTVYSETETLNVGRVAKKFAAGETTIMSPESACSH